MEDMNRKEIVMNVILFSLIFLSSVSIHVFAKQADQTTAFSENLNYAGQYNGSISGADHFYHNQLGDDKTVSLSYDYDGVHRLTRVTANAAEAQFNETFTYDNIGRIASAWRHGEAAAKLYYYQFGKSRLDYISEIHSLGNYTYDSNGNMTQDNAKDMTIDWDWRNQAEKFTLRSGPANNGAEVEMLYDASGDRVMKIERTLTDAKAVAYVGNELVYETDNIDSEPFKLTNAYISSPATTEGRIDYTNTTPTATHYYFQDHLGSTRAIISDNSTIAKADMFYAYGTKSPVQIGTINNRKEFTGKEFDNDGADENDENGMGLYYFGARYYDAEVGRWISTDPQSQFSDLYAYTGNGFNPISAIDPDGEEITSAVIAVSAYLTALTSSPDLATDLNMLAMDLSRSDFVGAAGDIVGVLAPAVPATGPRAAAKGIQELSERLVAKYGTDIVKALKSSQVKLGGVYEFLGKKGKEVKEYVGQTKDFMTRIVQHFKKEKIADISTLKTTVMKEATKTEREVVEQLTIESKFGIENLLNERNPIGKKRKHLLKKKPPPPPPTRRRH